MREAKLGAAAMVALLVALGIVLAAGSAGAVPIDCTDPTTCEGGGEINDAPAVGIDVASMTVDEGQRVVNTGTYSDAQAGEVGIEVWISGPDGLARRCGTVTKTGTNSGTWSWSSTPNEGDVNSLDPLRCNDDGPMPLSATVVARDPEGAEGQAGFTMTVDNVAPRATLTDYGQPSSWREGDPRRFYQSYSVGSPLDPSHADREAGFQVAYDCGDGYGAWRAAEWQGYWIGNKVAGYNESGRVCASQDSGTRRIGARIKDKDGGVGERTETVTVENVAPTATFNVPDSVDEGGTFAVSLTEPQDPSPVDRQSLLYAFDCGSGYVTSSSNASTASCTAVGGSLTVRGKVTDKDGGETEYTREVAVNNVAPTGTIEINGGAAATKSRTVNLALAATDPLPGSGVGSMRFRNEDTETWSAWEPYATDRRWTLSGGDGDKSIYVQYRDNAGNVSTGETRDGIRLDTTPPETTVTSGPASLTRSTSASFGFLSEAGAGFQCSLDGAAFVGCASPKSYTNLVDGPHAFRVRAVDAAGNADPTPAARSWTVDATRPTVGATSPRHRSTTRDAAPTVRAVVRDNLTNLGKGNIRLYVNGKAVPAGKFSYSASTDRLAYNAPKLGKGKKAVRIVATDAAGNAGAKSWHFTIK